MNILSRAEYTFELHEYILCQHHFFVIHDCLLCSSGTKGSGRREAVWAEDDWTGWRGADLRPTRRRGLVILGPPRAWPLTSGAREAAASGLVTGEE